MRTSQGLQRKIVAFGIFVVKVGVNTEEKADVMQRSISRRRCREGDAPAVLLLIVTEE